ncbi:MAG: response regulator transcription factor [Gammaproteobacteria bacterium]|nr:response regulator transcription factor [Gammaproteobacteria bacterium]
MNHKPIEQAPGLLLVDDDEVLCQVLSRALGKREFTVQTAHSSEQALLAAQSMHPEYAIVDLRIGQDSGLNLIQQLVELEPGIRIVVLTGYASISTAVESIKLGALHYLTKPADVEDILKAFHHDQGNADIELQSEPMSAKRMEWEHLQKVLNDYDGNISAAARAMGMHRRTLQRKLSKKPVQR